MYKDIFLNKKAVCFDMDGVLAHTHALWIQAHDVVMEQVLTYNINTAEEYVVPGRNLATTWKFLKEEKEFAQDVSVEKLVEMTRNAYLKILEEADIEPLEGFWQFLTKVRHDMGLKTAVATNASSISGKKLLEKLSLVNIFDVEVYGDQVKRKKPAPEMYLKVAKDLGVKPKDIVVFEDSAIGARAAEKAGTDLVVIWDTQIPKREYPSKALLFVPDFEVFEKTTDLTYKEAWDHAMENLGERIKKAQQPKE
jgi:HAD superfamily hydrolase (TIGR01509 family)